VPLKKLAAVVLLVASLSACIAPKSYVDPSFAKAGYQDIQRNAVPPHWNVTTEFQRQGSHYEAADAALHQQVEEVVRGSGIALPDASATGATLHVVVNNFGDGGDAAAKGFGTGLTFGLVGSTVTDYYAMTVTFTANGQTITKSGYRGALHTTIGNTSGPPGLKAVDGRTGFNQIVEQMLLNALSDIQSSAKISSWFALRG
jgi:hypothetical protein